MGNDEGSATVQEGAQTLLHQHLGEGIDVGGGLIQDKDARVGQKRAGEGDELALAHAEVATTLANGRVVALGEARNQVVCADDTGGLFYLRVGGVEATVADVLANAAGEEERVLLHDADLAAQRVLGHMLYVVSIDENGSLLYLVETGEQTGNGCLASSGGADDGDGLARVDMQIQVAQNWLVAFIAKSDILEIYRSLDGWQGLCIRVVYDFDGHIQYLEDALCRDAGALQLGILLAQVADRVEETIDIEGERHQDSDEQRAPRDEQSAIDDGEGDG